jgi:hypothetical protein
MEAEVKVQVKVKIDSDGLSLSLNLNLACLRNLAGVDAHHGREKFQGVGLGTLE